MTELPRPRWQSAAGFGALVVLGLILLVQFADLVRYGLEAVASTGQIDYGEGIVWKQWIEIVNGRGYAPIGGVPSIVFHYPPVYYLVTAVIAPIARDPLQAGRIVSLTATLGTVALVALVCRRLIGDKAEKTLALLCSLIAGLIFAHFYVVIFWAPLMRVDPIAVLFTMAAVYLALIAVDRPAAVYGAAALFVLAVFSKQTSVVAPVACLAPLLVWRRATGVRGVVTAVGLGLAVGLVLLWFTEWRVLSHLVTYNVNRFHFGGLVHTVYSAVRDFDIAAVLFGGVTVLVVFWQGLQIVRARRQPTSAELARLMVTLFVMLKVPTMVTLGKSGASSNYWVELLAPVSVMVGYGLYASQRFWMRQSSEDGREGRRSVATMLLAMAAPFVLILGQLQRPVGQLPPVADLEEQTARLAQIARGCDGMVVGDDMVAILRGGKDVVYEPSIFAELAATGIYDERPMLDAVRDGKVCALIIENNRYIIAGRWSAKVLAVAETALPRREVIGPWLVMRR